MQRLKRAAQSLYETLIGIACLALPIGFEMRSGLLAGALCYLAFLHLSRKDVRHRTAEEDVLLIRRWYLLRLPWFRVFLHHMHNPDVARYRHNHPWPLQAAYVICGGYFESREYLNPTEGTRYRTLEAGDWNLLHRRDEYHSIDQIFGNCWTLFFALGPKVRWGFLTPNGHVDKES